MEANLALVSVRGCSPCGGGTSQCGQTVNHVVMLDVSKHCNRILETVNVALTNIIARVGNFSCPPNAALSCNINGRPLPFSPDCKANIRAKYTMPLGAAMTLDLNADYCWQSEVQYDLAQSPDAIQGAYGIVNLSASLAHTNGWRVSLLVKNALNQSYATFLQNSGNNVNRYVPPDDQRYVGITARYEF